MGKKKALTDMQFLPMPDISHLAGEAIAVHLTLEQDAPDTVDLLATVYLKGYENSTTSATTPTKVVRLVEYRLNLLTLQFGKGIRFPRQEHLSCSEVKAVAEAANIPMEDKKVVVFEDSDD